MLVRRSSDAPPLSRVLFDCLCALLYCCVTVVACGNQTFFADPFVQEHVRLDAVVCLCDSPRLLRTLVARGHALTGAATDPTPSDRGSGSSGSRDGEVVATNDRKGERDDSEGDSTATLVMSQLALSDRVLLNKSDLMTPSEVRGRHPGGSLSDALPNALDLARRHNAGLARAPHAVLVSTNALFLSARARPSSFDSAVLLNRVDHAVRAQWRVAISANRLVCVVLVLVFSWVIDVCEMLRGTRRLSAQWLITGGIAVRAWLLNQGHELVAAVKGQFPGASIIRCERGQVDVDLVLGVDSFSLDKALEVRGVSFPRKGATG